MAQGWWKGLLDKLTARAVREKLDRRRLQAEIDMHRLYMLTSFQARRAAGKAIPESLAAELDIAAQRMGYEGTSSTVYQNLNVQFAQLSGAMHDHLSQNNSLCPAAAQLLKAGPNPQPKAAAQQRRGGGLAMATGSDAAASSNPVQVADEARQPQQSPAGPMITMQQLEAAMQEAVGYSMSLATSVVWQAGRGLWVRGTAPAGSLLAMYPGVLYNIAHHRQIPGYPRVDRDNSFLVSRFDGSILDAKAWGAGRENLAASWPDNARNPAEAELRHLEGRNPYALAHFANHPEAGEQPNVMLAPLDLSLHGKEAKLRAYLPNLDFQPASTPGSQSAAIAPADVGSSPGRGLALVALRDVRDEEILLNYRLSPGMAQPDWYTPVDEAEDRRRWA